MTKHTVFGVSPAFVLSGWGERFSTADYCAAVEMLGRLGFEAVQLEVYFPGQLGEWLDGGAHAVAARCADLGITPTQFVAHFLMPAFGEDLLGPAGPEEMKKVLAILEPFEACRVVTVPIGAIRPERADPVGPGGWRALRGRLVEKLATLASLTEKAGRRLALEVPPYTLAGGSDGFAALAAEVGGERLGFTLDTGHSWACKELVAQVPSKLGGRIVGTHLCDNLGLENAKLRPGAGSIPWEPLLRNLRLCGYAGSLDLEIRCTPDKLAEEYTAGRAYLQQVLARL